MHHLLQSDPDHAASHLHLHSMQDLTRPAHRLFQVQLVTAACCCCFWCIWHSLHSHLCQCLDFVVGSIGPDPDCLLVLTVSCVLCYWVSQGA